MTDDRDIEMGVFAGSGEEEPLVLVTVLVEEPEVEDRVQSLENILQPHKAQDIIPLVRIIREWADDPFPAKNRMAILFSSKDLNEIKTLPQQMENNKTTCYKIILLDVKKSNNLYKSFEKEVKNCYPKMKFNMDKEKFPDEGAIENIYYTINRKNSVEFQTLFVFIGAETFDQIRQFLPQGKVVLPFCQFLVTTCSETYTWKSDLESKLVEWSINKCLLFDRKLICFDWEGVYSPSELPVSFLPSIHFTGRDEIMKQLFSNIFPPQVATVPSRSDGCQCKKRKRTIPFQPMNPAPDPPVDPPPCSSLTVITGIAGIGKTELVKKFLSMHSHLFAKVVVIDPFKNNLLMDSFKICAYTLGFRSMNETPIVPNFDSEPCDFTRLASTIIKLAKSNNQRVLFLFEGLQSLDNVKDYLPKDPNCHVIATSRNRDWETDDHLAFYTDNDYNFQVIHLFEGLSLDETHELCSKILPQFGILYVKQQLEESIDKLHKYTGGFPLDLQRLTNFISKSSKSNPELSPNLHILYFLVWHIQNILDSFTCAPKDELVLTLNEIFASHPESQVLFQILCLLSPDQVDFVTVCYFYLEHHDKPFTSLKKLESYTTEQICEVDRLLSVLEQKGLIQITEIGTRVDADGITIMDKCKIRIPTFIRDTANHKSTIYALRDFLCNWSLSPASLFSPLELEDLRPHIISLNELYSRRYGYYNEVLLQCIRSHLDSWKNSPEGITGESLSSDEKYRVGKEKMNELLKSDPYFQTAFRNFLKVEIGRSKIQEVIEVILAYFVPVLFFGLCVFDVASDIYSTVIIFKAGYLSHGVLSVILWLLPLFLLCQLHYKDRNDYKQHVQHLDNVNLRWHDRVRKILGTIDSYIRQLWLTIRFRESKKIEKGLLFERLCTLKANLEFQCIVESFLESLPQLLYQFPLYLLSYTAEYSDLRKVMRNSYIPYSFEISMGLSLFSIGLALTKLESVYFGWNLELNGIKLLGYRTIHFLLNVTHVVNLVFCSGIVCVVFPSLLFVISLVIFATASAWILSNTDRRINKWIQGSLERIVTTKPRDLLRVLASYHPTFVDQGGKLESSLKHDFVTARLGHDILLLRRLPRKSDIIYFCVFFFSVLTSVFPAAYCYFNDCQSQNPLHTDAEMNGSYWAFQVTKKYSFFFLLWLPVLFMLQVLRHILNDVYLKYSNVPTLTEDYILNDEDGIIRYPPDSERWIQRRLYYQQRQNNSVFVQTWEQGKQNFKEFRENQYPTQFKIVAVLLGKFTCTFLYFACLVFLLYFVAYNTTLLRMYSRFLSNNSYLCNNVSLIID